MIRLWTRLRRTLNLIYKMKTELLPQGLITAKEMHALNIGAGMTEMSLRNWHNAFLALGYKLDAAMKCTCTARTMTGDFAGINYPCLNYGLKHIESGLSAFHVDCPRPNWEAVKELRNMAVITLDGKWVVGV